MHTHEKSYGDILTGMWKTRTASIPL